MNKSSGNFLTGLILGKMLNGNKGSGSPNNGGCLTSLLGFAIIAVLIMVGVNYGIKGVIALLVVTIVIIPVIIGVIKGNVMANQKRVEEAWELFNQKRYTQALEKAEMMADKNADAALLAGVLYLNGDGCNADPKKAFSFFEKGYKKNVEAQAYYGFLLLVGAGCEQNIPEGKKQLISAVQKGNTYAMLRLGECQLRGENGVEKNIEQGMKNLRKAADDNVPYAKYLVGVMQFEGRDGVPLNKEKGLSLIKEAAENDVRDAQDYLSTLEE